MRGSKSQVSGPRCRAKFAGWSGGVLPVRREGVDSLVEGVGVQRGGGSRRGW